MDYAVMFSIGTEMVEPDFRAFITSFAFFHMISAAEQICRQTNVMTFCLVEAKKVVFFGVKKWTFWLCQSFAVTPLMANLKNYARIATHEFAKTLIINILYFPLVANLAILRRLATNGAQTVAVRGSRRRKNRDVGSGRRERETS